MADLRSAPVPPGLVEPFFFGQTALYGCLHPGSRTDRGAVICYPFGHEYITIHRAARQLATQISRAGLPTLRFDYSGTGDSAGDLEQARLDDWVGDIGRAADELRARTGVAQVSLIGIRLGAALALAASEGRQDVESLALWDPVIWGRAYLRELNQDTRRMRRVAHVLASPSRQGAAKRKSAGSGGVDRQPIEVLGFEVSKALASDLRGLELDTIKPGCVDRTLLLETTKAATAPLGAVLRGAGCNVETRTEALPHAWRWSEDITRVQLPHAQVRAIARWVVGETT